MIGDKLNKKNMTGIHKIKNKTYLDNVIESEHEYPKS
jgi:hypothetical protein